MKLIFLGFLFFANLSFAQSWRVEGNSGKITKTGDGTFTFKYYNQFEEIKTYNLSRTKKKSYQLDCVTGTYNVIEATYNSVNSDHYFIITWSFACDGKYHTAPICFNTGIIKMYDGLDNLINEFTIECND